MDYTLDRLGSDNFETLVQSLCTEILGNGLKVYGRGPDGQREAVFLDKTDFPSAAAGWSGYFVVQAKYKDPSSKENDYSWLKKQFEDEMEGFKQKKKLGKQIPDNYLFFTNVILTPVYETGVKDKIDALANGYTDLIKNIRIIGKDEICVYLNKYRSVACAYTAFITSGDILTHLYSAITRKEKERLEALMRYVERSFNDDWFSRMDQAGKLTEEKASIDKIYVDLRMSGLGGDRRAVPFIKTAVSMGERRWDANVRREKSELRNKLVLRGGAGQGKSTVCQFLAQIYRATFLEKYDSNCSDKVTDFLSRVKADGIDCPLCARIPVRIELRMYSAYIAERKSAGKNYDLITYISSEIARKSASEFDNDTLRHYLGCFSFAFIFDGLDEVSENSNRKEVMRQIEVFTDIELRRQNTDCTFFATTRPEGYTGEFTENGFVDYKLMEFSAEECLDYLNKLLDVLDEDERRAEHLEKLTDALRGGSVSYMMKTPLQATIMTILVRSDGDIPRDKYTLFKEYFGIILRREKQKHTSEVLNFNGQLIEDVYYLLGYELQKISSESDKGDALISSDGFVRIIERQLEINGMEKGSDEFEKLKDDVYKTVVHRVNFAAEISEGKVGFPIRSMQEFLAAVYIKHTYGDPELKRLLAALACNSYWQNTFLFLIECIDREKPYFTDVLIDTVLSELNGATLPTGETNAPKGVYYGSQTAYKILTANIFKNKPRCENKLCKHFEKLCLLRPTIDYMLISEASDNVKNELCNFILSDSDGRTDDGKAAFAAMLSEDGKYFEKLKPFIASRADKVLGYYVSFMGGYAYCPKELVICGLNASERVLGEMGSLAYIADVIPLCDKRVKKMFFAAVIRNICMRTSRGDGSVSEYSDKLGAVFGVDFKPLYRTLRMYDNDLYNPFGNNEISLVSYRLPSRKIDFTPLASKAEELGLKTAAITLRALSSYDIKDYRAFYEAVSSDASEIESTGLDRAIADNSVCDCIWKAVKSAETDGVLSELNEELEHKLKNAIVPKTYEELYEEESHAIKLFGLRLRVSFVSLELYERTVAECGEEKILGDRRLLDFVIFAYGCASQFYDESNDKCKKLFMKALPQALGFVKAYGKPHVWSDVILMFAVEHMPQSRYGEIADCMNGEPLRKTFVHRRRKLQDLSCAEERLKKWARFTELTKNKFACEYLAELMLFYNDVDLLQKINFGNLSGTKDPRFALAEMLFDSEKDRSDEIKEFVKKHGEERFVFGILKSCGSSREHALECDATDILAFLLERFRRNGDDKSVAECESRITDIISASRMEDGLLK